jgi:hypothetical protein
MILNFNRVKPILKIIKKFKIENWKYFIYTKKSVVLFDENWFKNKRVAIIGGADSAFMEKLGGFIDEFDVIVRINIGVEVIDKFNEYIGTRTDFLFHSLYEEDKIKGGSPITLDLWKKHNVKNLIFCLNKELNGYSYNNFKSFILKTKGSFKLSEVPLNISKKNLEVVRPFSPTTGFIALNTIFNCKPSHLYITGITFFKTSHLSEYRQGTADYYKQLVDKKDHDFHVEYLFFKKLYLNNVNLIYPDKTLKKILEEH